MLNKMLEVILKVINIIKNFVQKFIRLLNKFSNFVNKVKNTMLNYYNKTVDLLNKFKYFQKFLNFMYKALMFIYKFFRYTVSGALFIYVYFHDWDVLWGYLIMTIGIYFYLRDTNNLSVEKSDTVQRYIFNSVVDAQKDIYQLEKQEPGDLVIELLALAFIWLIIFIILLDWRSWLLLPGYYLYLLFLYQRKFMSWREAWFWFFFIIAYIFIYWVIRTSGLL